MPYDDLLVEIADYVHDYPITSELAIETAYQALLDSLGCAMLALQHPACVSLLGPFVPGTMVPEGVHVPGTSFRLDPIKAAFDISACIRWLDYNDTWLAAEWGHPSDNIGGILSVADFLAQRKIKKTNPKTNAITLQEVLFAMIKAYEIQGVLALANAFNKIGLDHVLLVKVATSAVVAKLLGFTKAETLATLSHAWLDGHSLRTYRHAPHTGPRKSWAAADASSRGVWLAWMVQQGQMGYPHVLTAKQYGFQAVYWQQKPLEVARPFGSYVMENILFKVAYPAEFHAQTAVECGIALHNQVKNKIDTIERIEITTQEPAMRIINKQGELTNFADRDHCLQYMVAIALLFGELNEHHYSDEVAKNTQINWLRDKMQVQEDKTFTEAYLHPEKRAIPNAVQVFFRDGSQTEKVTIHYPLGHRTRRQEAASALKEKYTKAIATRFQGKQKEILQQLWEAPQNTLLLTVDDFMDRWRETSNLT